MSEANDAGESPEGESIHEAAVDSDERASERVIEAVSAVSGESPTSLSPLYDALDPDALDSLVDHARRTDRPADPRIEFSYEGYDVFVRGDGTVLVAER